MTVRADGCLWVRFAWAALLPAGHYFRSGNIMGGVAFLTRQVNFARRVHNIRRRRVVLVVSVGV
jgi:hypothetical protein